MNTTVNYVYRDAENNKYFGAHTFAGEITLELATRLQATLHDGSFFIAEQVDVEPAYPWTRGESAGYYDDVDHPYMSLQVFAGRKPASEDAFRMLIASRQSDLCLTDAAPTDGRTIEDFVLAMEKAHEEGWNHAILSDQWGAN